MDLVNVMRGKLSQAGQSTAQKAKDLSELAKLNAMVSGAEKQITELYGKIGYEVCRAYRDEPLPEAADLMEQVKELHQSIENWRQQIKALSSSAVCPQCGAKLSKGMAFCSQCGCKLPAAAQPAAGQTKFCSSCGAPVAADAAFCPSCGQKV